MVIPPVNIFFEFYTYAIMVVVWSTTVAAWLFRCARAEAHSDGCVIDRQMDGGLTACQRRAAELIITASTERQLTN